MANKNAKPPNAPWKPGQSGNPLGRAVMSKEIRDFRETTYKDFIAKLQEFGFYTVEELQEYVRRTDITAFDRIFAVVIAKACQGDKDARQVLFDRLWGKVKEQIDLTSLGAGPQVVITLPDNGRDKKEV